MKGTLTYHLPLKRGPETPPEATLIVRRVSENEWHAGLAVCSIGDQFVKKYGRNLAYHRLCGKPIGAKTPQALTNLVADHFVALRKNRPHVVSMKTLLDLDFLPATLNKMRIE